MGAAGRAGKAPRVVRTQDPAPFTGHGVPHLPRIYVPRLHLYDQLDRATEGAVTQLVAPSGAGKTLGVAGWLRQREVARKADVGAWWIRGGGSWDRERMDDLLAQAEEGQKGPRLVVVDDAHLLPPSALRAIDRRLSDSPDSIRLLLLSRWDLPLSRLVPELLGHSTVIRGRVLQLTDDETAALVAGHGRTESAEVVNDVIAHARGWAAVVVLLARAIGAAPDPDTTAERFVSQGLGAADWVASEVFSTLSPRERHVLLCSDVQDGVSASSAALLSQDSGAGEILASLASTGLLVTRMEEAASGETASADAGPDEASYRIHPLLGEVVRRRLAAGGVDVVHARATVVRGVRMSHETGTADRAFERLVGVNAVQEAVDLIVDDGVDMVLTGRAAALPAFVRRHRDAVEAQPRAWFAVALERWLADDVTRARAWMDRILALHEDPTAEQGPVPVDRAEAPMLAAIHLARARLGLEPLAPAVERAVQVSRHSLEAATPAHGAAPAVPYLLSELGVTQNWTGDLTEAESNLTTAVAMSKALRLDGLTADAMSHLAFTQYMAGRESVCVRVATDALDVLGQAFPGGSGFARERAALALALGRMSDLARPGEIPAAGDGRTPVHSADLCTRFWARMRDSRMALVRGAVAEAEGLLSVPLEIPTGAGTLPRHLQIAVWLEQAFLAALASDQDAVLDLARRLEHLPAEPEAALVSGLHADLGGDRNRARDLFETASGEGSVPQPAVRALALTCLAQISDVLGQPDAALARLREAALVTEIRRNAVPFLGWSRQGTPVHVLLSRLAERTVPNQVSGVDWVHELAEISAGRPDISTVLSSRTATPAERSAATVPMVPPLLTPREREVLNGLARGATYADIGASLFVSENTVKTHVSSLYAKLAVSRRSEALAVARTFGLL